MVVADRLVDYWPEVWRPIAEAMEYSGGRYSISTILDELLCGSMQLWVILNGESIMAPMITQVLKYPTGIKVCNVFAIGGYGAKEWLDTATDVTDEWARSLGCAKVQVIGRPGWRRMLKNWGKEVAVMMERSI